MAPSDKQLSFIRRLLADRMVDEHTRVEANEVLDGSMDRRQASGIIERLLNAPRAEAQPQRQAENVRVTEPGVYRLDGEVFIVKPNREKTKLYAKRMVETGGTRVTETGEHVNVEFEYAPGAVYRLSPADRMPLEDAKALTARYGRCIVCGRHLKDAKSVEAGIGPVCRTYFTVEPQPVEGVPFDCREEDDREAGLPAGSPGSRHPFTMGELAEMNERSGAEWREPLAVQ